MSNDVIYAVIVPVDARGKAVADICWGKCGKGCIGSISIPIDATHAFSCIPCNETKCEYLDKQMDLPGCEYDDRPVVLRRITTAE